MKTNYAIFLKIIMFNFSGFVSFYTKDRDYNNVNHSNPTSTQVNGSSNIYRERGSTLIAEKALLNAFSFDQNEDIEDSDKTLGNETKLQAKGIKQYLETANNNSPVSARVRPEQSKMTEKMKTPLFLKNPENREKFIEAMYYFITANYSDISSILGTFRLFLVFTRSSSSNKNGLDHNSTKNTFSRRKIGSDLPERDWQDEEEWFLFFYGNCNPVKRGQESFLESKLQQHIPNSFLMAHTDFARERGNTFKKRIQTLRGGLNLLFDCVGQRDKKDEDEQKKNQEKKSYSQKQRERIKTQAESQFYDIYSNKENILEFYDLCNKNKPTNNDSLWKLAEGIKKIKMDT